MSYASKQENILAANPDEPYKYACLIDRVWNDFKLL